MFDCREIAILDGMDQTVLEMLLDDILADLVQSSLFSTIVLTLLR